MCVCVCCVCVCVFVCVFVCESMCTCLLTPNNMYVRICCTVGDLSMNLNLNDIIFSLML